MEPKPVHPIKQISEPHHEDPVYWADMKKEEEEHYTAIKTGVFINSALASDDFDSLAEAFGCE